MNITTATPVEIDTRIAELHGEVGQVTRTIDQVTDRVLSHAGLRVYVPATWQNRRSGYRTLGTFEDGVAKLREHQAAMAAWRDAGYPRDAMPARLSDYAGEVDLDQAVAQRDAGLAKRYALWAQINELQAEWIRRGRWNRYYLVTSSAGHIHSSTSCQTCRITTEFGWMPDMSGQTETEAISELGRHADSLCSVCFPSAPVAAKRTNVTKAQAIKLAAATVAKES